jgi:hypothetical protein
MSACRFFPLSRFSCATVYAAQKPDTVGLALRSKIASHPKQFTLVDTKDPELSLIVTADCIPRKQKTDPFTWCSRFTTATGSLDDRPMRNFDKTCVP